MPPTMRRQINRISPAGKATDYQSYRVLAPLSSHYRPASCEEAGCLQHRNGWRTRVEGLQPADLAAIRDSGRHYTRLPVAPGETYLVFPAGQACFKTELHRVPLERPGIFQLRQGDHRLTRAGVRTFQRPEDWVDHFGEHQLKLVDQRNKG